MARLGSVRLSGLSAVTSGIETGTGHLPPTGLSLGVMREKGIIMGLTY